MSSFPWKIWYLGSCPRHTQQRSSFRNKQTAINDQSPSINAQTWATGGMMNLEGATTSSNSFSPIEQSLVTPLFNHLWRSGVTIDEFMVKLTVDFCRKNKKIKAKKAIRRVLEINQITNAVRRSETTFQLNNNWTRRRKGQMKTIKSNQAQQ